MLYTIVTSLLLSASLQISAITTTQLIAKEGFPVIYTDFYGYNILDLSSRNLHDIGSIDQLPVIFKGKKQPFATVPNSKLVLSNNNLQELPHTIGSITELKALFASDNNLISLPESISSLSHLENLYLARNKIEYLPDSIGYLSNLKVLDLNTNKLTSLPLTMSYLTHLTHAFLNDNQLILIPLFADGVLIDIRNNCFKAMSDCSQQLNQTYEDFLGEDDGNDLFTQQRQDPQIDWLIFPS